MGLAGCFRSLAGKTDIDTPISTKQRSPVVFSPTNNWQWWISATESAFSTADMSFSVAVLGCFVVLPSAWLLTLANLLSKSVVVVTELNTFPP